MVIIGISKYNWKKKEENNKIGFQKINLITVKWYYCIPCLKHSDIRTHAYMYILFWLKKIFFFLILIGWLFWLIGKNRILHQKFVIFIEYIYSLFSYWFQLNNNSIGNNHKFQIQNTNLLSLIFSLKNLLKSTRINIF